MLKKSPRTNENALNKISFIMLAICGCVWAKCSCLSSVLLLVVVLHCISFRLLCCGVCIVSFWVVVFEYEAYPVMLVAEQKSVMMMITAQVYMNVFSGKSLHEDLRMRTPIKLLRDCLLCVSR